MDRAIALEPGDTESYCERGMLGIELGQYAEAVEDLNQAVSLDPRHPFAESDRRAAAELAGAAAPHNPGTEAAWLREPPRYSAYPAVSGIMIDMPPGIEYASRATCHTSPPVSSAPSNHWATRS